MIVVENECCDCDLPCIYGACRYYNVARFFCDDCGCEEDLWYFDNQELCADCILERLEEVSYNGQGEFISCD